MADLSDEDKKLLTDNGFNPDDMSEQEQKDILEDIKSEKADKPSTKAKKRYWRSALVPGLSVQIAEPPQGEVAPIVERFVPYLEPYGDEMRKVGYLATDSERANAILAEDPNAEELSGDEYRKAINNKKARKTVL